MEHLRDLVIGEDADFLLVSRVVSPFIRRFDGGLALFNGSGQLAVEVWSVSDLSVGGLFLRCGRASGRRERRSLRGRNEYRGRKEKLGVYRVQIWESEMRILAGRIGDRDQDAVETGEGEHDVLGKFLGGINTGQGQALANGCGVSIGRREERYHLQTRGEPFPVATGAPGRCQTGTVGGGCGK
jgi:hypothetical protein